MKRVVLIHGNGGGTGQDAWYPWLKAKLQEMGVACETPNMPDSVAARSSIWLPYMHDVLRISADTILVGHSSGAIAAMRYAETHKIAGSVLVATYHTDTGDEGEKASGYFDTPWNWDSIRRNQPWITIFASTDDPFIPIAEPRFVQSKLGAEYHEFDDQGHFGVPTSKTEFPELLEALKPHLV